MPDSNLALRRQIDAICDRFEEQWSAGQPVDWDAWRDQIGPPHRDLLLTRLLEVDLELRQAAGQSVQPEDYQDLGSLAIEQARECLHSMAAAAADAEIPSTTAQARSVEPPRQIGPFKLLQRIGEGGMGTVWMADQQQPVRRRVALKVIKAGMDSRQVIARFEAERQALAMMDHQNIARVLDAGMTDDGRPYFAMELVQGIPINQYCDENKLSLNERLELFVPVCHAVQHAHQKGIIHRDLKPSNVLVTLYDGKPVPKVIDFGLAKALQHQMLTDKTVFTEFGQVVGTLQYMSPEQAEMNALDVDTRTDIYSLGVMLYELLTGSTPLETETLRQKALLEVIRVIREAEPPRPSTRLSESGEAITGISAQRQIAPSRLQQILRGELDWIVMKALEKDRSRRYETANGLGLDVQRYLEGDPVTARPPSATYRVGKFVRKHRAAVVTAITIVILLIGGIAGTSWGMLLASQRAERERLANTAAQKDRNRATEAQKKAEDALAEEQRQRRYAEAVADLVQDDFLVLTSVEGQSTLLDDIYSRELRKETTLAELLDRAAKKLDQRTDISPEIESGLRNIIGVSFRANGDAEKGIPFLEQSVKLRELIYGPDHQKTLVTKSELAQCYYAAGRFEEARKLAEQTFERMKAVLGDRHEDTLVCMNNLAMACCETAQTDLAIPLMEQALKLSTETLGTSHRHTLLRMSNLAVACHSAGQREKALNLLEQVFELRKKHFGVDQYDTLMSAVNLAEAYRVSRQFDNSLTLLEEFIPLIKSKLGEEHPITLSALNNMAGTLLDRGRAEEALPLLRQTLKIKKSKLGPHHPQTLIAMNNLAVTLDKSGHLDEALPLMRECHEGMKVRYGASHPSTVVCLVNLANACRDSEQFEDAIPLYEEILEIRTSAGATVDKDTIIFMGNLARCYELSGQPKRAIQGFEQALELAIEKLGADHFETLTTMNNLAAACWKQKMLDKSVPLFERLVELSSKRFGASTYRTILYKANLGTNYRDAGRLDEAIELYREVCAKTSQYPQLEYVRGRLRKLYVQVNRVKEFQEMAENDLAVAREDLAAKATELAEFLSNLGLDFLTIGDPVRAEELLVEASSIFEEHAPEDWRACNSRSILGGALLAQSKLDECAPLLLMGYSGLKHSAGIDT